MSNVYIWSHLQHCLGTFLPLAGQRTRIRRIGRITFQYPQESDRVDYGDLVHRLVHRMGQPHRLSKKRIRPQDCLNLFRSGRVNKIGAKSCVVSWWHNEHNMRQDNGVWDNMRLIRPMKSHSWTIWQVIATLCKQTFFPGNSHDPTQTQ